MTIKLNKVLAYEMIINRQGNPHLASIQLLEDIIDHYQLELVRHPDHPQQMILSSPLEAGWQIDYQYFKAKYNFGHAKIRYAFRKLEQYDLMVRKRVLNAHIPFKAQGGSAVYIQLNLENIIKLLIF